MSCSRTQHGDGRSRTQDLSLRSPTLYHWATALPSVRMCVSILLVEAVKKRDWGLCSWHCFYMVKCRGGVGRKSKQRFWKILKKWQEVCKKGSINDNATVICKSGPHGMGESGSINDNATVICKSGPHGTGESGDIKMSLQCWAYTRTLQRENSISPLFPCSYGPWLQMTPAQFQYHLNV